MDNELLVKALLEQKKCNDTLVDALVDRIKELEESVLEHSEISYIPYSFLRDHVEFIPEYVALAYRLEPNLAKEVVGSLHDETFDLSKLECTGNDFKPWKVGMER